MKDTSESAETRSILGAVFLMATGAIGPGFITQTTVFTVQLGAAFAFAIVVSTLIDIAVQLNVWRVIGVSGLRAQTLGNRVAPGMGWLLATLVFAGGAVFNIGNIAGAGLGMNALFGLEPIRISLPVLQNMKPEEIGLLTLVFSVSLMVICSLLFPDKKEAIA